MRFKLHTFSKGRDDQTVYAVEVIDKSKRKFHNATIFHVMYPDIMNALFRREYGRNFKSPKRIADGADSD